LGPWILPQALFFQPCEGVHIGHSSDRRTIPPMFRWELGLPPNEEDNMHPILRIVLTALLAIALAWPLLFWGKPALSDLQDRYPEISQPVFNKTPRAELLW
jgi:hypothetical protein